MAQTDARKRLNVLFIAVDDLRPALGCYGDAQARTPHIDELAKTGLVMQRAYAQVAVCSPSRSSLLTGLRPDTVKIFDNHSDFRSQVPQAVTLPQYFRAHGYQTVALGKIFHSCFEHAYVGRTLEDPLSWSEPPWYPAPQYYYTKEGIDVARSVYGRMPAHITDDEGKCIHNRSQPLSRASLENVADPGLDEWNEHFVQGNISEAPDVADNVLYDGQVAERAIKALAALRYRPFFLAVGFMKPHTPYVAPKRYWDLYDPARIKIADNQFPPKGAPSVALEAAHDHAAYSGAPQSGPLDKATARHLTHGYYACVSYMDAQVGRILSELKRLGLERNTIVILWGDHGYHLGENGRWGKQTNFEVGTRVPLLIRAPSMRAAGKASKALVELVDIYPTLCELAEIPLRPELEGLSFAALLDHPNKPWKKAAFSQFPRPVRVNRPANAEDVMGYSIRTARYRHTVWRKELSPHTIIATELYDYARDPQGNINVAAERNYAKAASELAAQLQQEISKRNK